MRKQSALTKQLGQADAHKARYIVAVLVILCDRVHLQSSKDTWQGGANSAKVKVYAGLNQQAYSAKRPAT